MTNKFIEQRVEALENELSELKLIVAQIRKPSTVVEEALANDVIEFEGKQYKKVDREAHEGDVIIMTAKTESDVIHTGRPYKVDENKQIEGFGIYRKGHGLNRTRETVAVYELMDGYNPGIVMVDETPIKTANQLRAEIIEKAKGFVVDNLAKNHSHRAYFVSVGPYVKTCDVTFHVNTEKRTVVALVHGAIDKRTVRFKGIAKCDPSDVFNEHIGKAIALGRALGLDVSEFEQAVQPTELVVGHVTIWSDDFNTTYTVNDIKDNKAYCNNSTDYWSLPIRKIDVCNIINDTNAIYETAVNE